MIRYKCKGCNAILYKREILEAKNPFYSDIIVQGCPNCFDIDNFHTMCHYINCMDIATSSTNGKYFCYKHYKAQDDK